MNMRTRVLSHADIRKIHATSLEVMEKLGIHIQDPEALKTFEKAGAKVDWDSERAFIPTYLVNEVMTQFNPYLSLYNTDGRRMLTLVEDSQYFASIGYANFVLDWRTGETRDVYSRDLEEIVKLCESMDALDLVHPPGQPVDDPPELGDLYQAKTMLLTTRKPIHTHAYTEEHAEKLIAMNAAVMGGRDELRKKPHLIFNINTFSPLAMRKDAAEVIRTAAKNGVPFLVTAGCMGGATSPVTLAGELAQANAEILSHIIYGKLVHPTASVIYASWCRIFDMKYSTCTVATPEFALMRLAISQLAEFYHLPSAGGALLADSNTIDAQYGWEKFMTALLPSMGGLNIIFGMGLLSQMNVMSCEALVMDGEIARIIKRIQAGITVDSEHLAFDIIARECEKSGFLDNPHTYKHFRQEHFIPSVSDRSMRATWQEDGEQDVRIRAREVIEERLDAYQKPQLPDSLEQTLEDIIKSS